MLVTEKMKEALATAVLHAEGKATDGDLAYARRTLLIGGEAFSACHPDAGTAAWLTAIMTSSEDTSTPKGVMTRADFLSVVGGKGCHRA